MNNTTRALEKIFNRLVVPKINGIYDRLGIDNSIRIKVNNKVGESIYEDGFVDAYYINVYFRNGGASHGVYVDISYLLFLSSKYIITDKEYALVMFYHRWELKNGLTLFSSENKYDLDSFDTHLKNIEDSLSPLES